MKTLHYTPWAIMALCLIFLQSCMMSTVSEEIEEAVKNGATGKSEDYSKEDYCNDVFSVQIINSAESTSLQIDSIEICNILVNSPATNTLSNGNLIIHSPSMQINCGTSAIFVAEGLPTQIITPWNPDYPPLMQNNSYVRIYGVLFTYLTGSQMLEHFRGEMYAPLSGRISAEQEDIAKIEISPNCPIYCYTGEKMEKILQEINFDVTVDEW